MNNDNKKIYSGTYSHVTGLMEKKAAEKLDQAYGNRTQANSTAASTAEPRPAKFVAKQGKKRKPGTGCISQVSKNTWQGKYTPRNPDGTRQCHVVYAKSYEECEKKLEEMIANLKAGGGVKNCGAVNNEKVFPSLRCK